MTLLTGNGIRYAQIAAWKAGLKACKIGLRVNSAYTPKRLKQCVEATSGKTFKRGDYDGMIAECQALMDKIIADEGIVPLKALNDTTRES